MAGEMPAGRSQLYYDTRAEIRAKAAEFKRQLAERAARESPDITAEDAAAEEPLAGPGCQVAPQTDAIPVPSKPPSPSFSSSQSSDESGELLESFKPRKEARRTSQEPQQSGADEFTGFGHLSVSQAMKEGDTMMRAREAPSPTASATHQSPAKKQLAKKTAAAFCSRPVPPPARASQSTATTGLTKMSSKLSVTSHHALSSHKRPASATITPFADDRRASLSSMPKIAKRTYVASPQSPARSGEDAQATSSDNDQERPPKWYRELKVKNVRGKNGGNVDTLLQALRGQITKCQTANRATQQNAFDQIREKLHTIIFEQVNEQLLRANRMLHDADGLPQLFDERYAKDVHYPFDIRADAHELYYKWCKRVFETDILRGIISKQKEGDKKDGPRVNNAVDPRHAVSSKYHGNGNLLNGQWWPLQLCCLRDGAHGVSQGGISGRPQQGAYSCIMSGGHDYPDVDNGDEVLYCGTDSTDGSVTEYTQRMLESVGNEPVRLIRSHNLGGKYAPILGFRYDGLYDVISSEMLDAPGSLRQRHRFRLVRRPGQDPIRGGDGPERRPTMQEEEKYRTHQKLMKGGN